MRFVIRDIHMVRSVVKYGQSGRQEGHLGRCSWCVRCGKSYHRMRDRRWQEFKWVSSGAESATESTDWSAPDLDLVKSMVLSCTRVLCIDQCSHWSWKTLQTLEFFYEKKSRPWKVLEFWSSGPWKSWWMIDSSWCPARMLTCCYTCSFVLCSLYDILASSCSICFQKRFLFYFEASPVT